MEDKKMLNEEELENVNGGAEILLDEDESYDVPELSSNNGNNGKHNGNTNR